MANTPPAAAVTAQDAYLQTPEINQGPAAIEADDTISDEGYAQSTTTSYVSSIASDIRKGVEENGRTYAAYGSHEYGMPIDEREQDRADFQHCKFTLLLSGQLHLAPISASPGAILDLGCGSGIWAIGKLLTSLLDICLEGLQ